MRLKSYLAFGAESLKRSRENAVYSEADKNGQMIIHELYLDPFVDMCNREIISYSISIKPSAKNIMDALDKTIDITSYFPFRRIFHFRSRMVLSDESIH